MCRKPYDNIFKRLDACFAHISMRKVASISQKLKKWQSLFRDNDAFHKF